MMEPPEIIARTGWTTGELLDAIGTAQIRPPYQLVSLLIGVNNQYRGYSQEEYRAEFAVLLTQAIDFAGGDPARVLVVSIPDWGVTSYAERFHQETVSREIDVFNKINRQEADRLGVHYVDVTSISRRAEQEAELIAEDGLHPSGKMYSKWIEVILPAAQEALGVGEDR
jgi:lysophospholipase L1-like esterase